MFLKKRVKAGILLYSLLISAVFSLLLQFYLNRVIVMERQFQSQIISSKAHLMAEITQDLATEDSGQLSFDQGTTNYTRNDGQLKVQVRLENGQFFDYKFLKKEIENAITQESALMKE